MSSSRRLHPPRVIVFEDREVLAVKIERLVWRSGGAATHVAVLEDAVRDVRRGAADVVLVRQDLPRRQGLLAAAVLPEIRDGLRLFLYADRVDPLVTALVERTRRSLIVLREEQVPQWIAAALPVVARRLRDGRRLSRLCRPHFVLEPSGRLLPSAVLPLRLTDVVGGLEECLVRAAVERTYSQPHPSVRKAAVLLGLGESVMRSKMRKLNIPWVPPPLTDVTCADHARQVRGACGSPE